MKFKSTIYGRQPAGSGFGTTRFHFRNQPRKPRRFSVDEDLLTLSGDLSVYGVTAVYHWALDCAEMKDETTAIALSTSTGTQVVWPHQVPFCYAEQVRQFCLDLFGLDYTLPHARNPDVYADYESDDDDDETGPPADSDGNFEVDSIDCIRAAGDSEDSVMFLVSWKGYMRSTWEPHIELLKDPNTASMVEDFINENPRLVALAFGPLYLELGVDSDMEE
ncbi:unnamed protein product [Oikopleura dioica]|uniref:Chromo domain-containing protein n=1 Tax=Oikopleura dioica TaxID=34765 RepID=E4WUF9_OIKDI|nr:unnamed protein product [Oikopleura dioica]